jgi:hypothetical protein
VIGRTALITLAALLIGLPASIAFTAAIARLAGMAGEAMLFAVVIGSNLIWTIMLFGALWVGLADRRS